MTDSLLIAIGMGHRNTRKGGARGEYDWTPGAARALQRVIRRHGGRAELIQEHDGDGDANFSTGRDIGPAAAKGLEGITAKHGTPDVILFEHYNGGAGAGFHALFPDGWDSDTKASNPRDVDMAQAIRDAVVETKTVTTLHWTKDSRGVMSERESGAVDNIRGRRLAEFAATERYQPTSVRLILEAGSIDTWERQHITNPAWTEHVYAEAVVEGIETVLGPLAGNTPVPTPDPVTPPETVHGRAIARKWAADAIAAGVPFVDLPDTNHPAGRSRWWRLDRPFVTTRDLARQQVALNDSRHVNEPVPAGTVIWIEFGGENYQGKAYGLSPWGTMFDMSGLRPVELSNEPDLYAVDPRGAMIGALAGTLAGALKAG